MANETYEPGIQRRSNIGERVITYNNKFVHAHKIDNDCTITFYADHYYVVVIFVIRSL